MFDQTLQQLRNSDPVQRRQAIVAIANSGDPRALSTLRKVAASDPDPALRTVAERAVHYVETKQTQPPSAPIASAPPPPEPPLQSDWGQQIQQMNAASSDPITQARGQLNNAFGSHASGDDAGAQAALARALYLNPAFADSVEVRTLASTITGLPPDEAITRLTAAPPKSKTPVASASDSCLTLIIELGILFIVLTVSFLLTFNLVRQNIGAILPPVSGTAQQTAAVKQVISQITNLPQSLVLVWAMVAAVFGVFGFLAWNGIIQLFSTIVLGGDGGWGEFLNAMLRIQIVTAIIGTIPVVLTFLTLRSTAAAQRNVNNIGSTITGLNGLGTVIAQVYFTSRVHKFDWVRGFVAVVLSPVIIGCSCVVLVFLASMLGAATTR